MDYGARYYAPLIGRFISADTIVPGAGNPQAFNRYSYVLNSPLKYVDPTGHISEDEASKATDWIKELEDIYGIHIDIDFGWVLSGVPGSNAVKIWNPGSWRNLGELDRVRTAIQDFAKQLGGARSFRDTVGSATINRLHGVGPNLSEQFGNAAGYSIPVINTVLLWDNAFDQLSELDTKIITVHELAHIWDFRSDMRMSDGMMAAIGNSANCIYMLCRDFKTNSKPIGPLRDYASSSPREDFAVSVSQWFYSGAYNQPADALTVDRRSYLDAFAYQPRTGPR